MPFFVTRRDWHRALADSLRDPDELLDLLQLPDTLREPARRAARLFPLLAPRSYVERMRRGDPRDPLLLQVLPLGIESDVAPGFTADPVGDEASRRAPGLLHKYQGRALLIATGACAVHCRYCFRRHYPYGDEPKRLEDWDQAFDAIASDTSVHEVILSGGDPLMLTDERLASLMGRAAAIAHVRRIRIHTRLPIVLPERVTEELVALLQCGGVESVDGDATLAAPRACSPPPSRGGRIGVGEASVSEDASDALTTILVVHANHPREIVGDCADALRRIVRAGIPVLNQAVLLRGINDDADTLAELCERLIDLGVMPYYLHQLDRVAGAAHFETSEQTGLALIAELRHRLPGYAVPRYVREVAGEAFKRPIA